MGVGRDSGSGIGFRTSRHIAFTALTDTLSLGGFFGGSWRTTKASPRAPKVTTSSSAPPATTSFPAARATTSSTAVPAATSCSPAPATTCWSTAWPATSAPASRTSVRTTNTTAAPAPTPWFCSSPMARRSSPRCSRTSRPSRTSSRAAPTRTATTARNSSSRASTSTCATSRRCRCSSSTRRRPRAPTRAQRTRTPCSWWPAPACWRTTATPTTSTCFPWSRAAPPARRARPSCSPPTAATPTTRAARSSCRSSADQTTTDTFSYTVKDLGGATATATVQVTVTGVNDAPVASPDSFATEEDVALTGNVLGNDTDVDSPALSATLVSGPAHGTLVFNADGSFTYTPNENYFGPDGFTYEASDGSLGSNVAGVSLTVNPVNDAPVANADAFTLDEDTTLTANV